MSFSDLFKSKQFKNEIASLKKQNEQLRKENSIKLSVQQMKPVELEEKVSSLEEKSSDLTNLINKKNEEIKQLSSRLEKLNDDVDASEKRLTFLDDQAGLEEYGLYIPNYSFANSSQYKERLSHVRDEQKEMIRNQTAAVIDQPMTFNNSKAKGKALQKKNIKQLLRAFNGECEAAVSKVTKSNIESIEKRINRSFTQLNKLNDTNGVSITKEYLNSKLDEAHIALEYALKKEEEKDILREQREKEREERKVQREIAAERKRYEKDELHFVNAEAEVTEKIKNAQESEVADLKKQLEELQSKLSEIREHKEKLDKREENPTAGYVYIISNIGSFGKNVFKIGVTRRLDPMERIHELGSASVPFPFDVHALIFSDDAYKLESALHNHFAKQRVNQINKRKEYFDITIDEIKEVLSKYKNLTFDFHELPEAQEYRDSLKMINNQQAN